MKVSAAFSGPIDIDSRPDRVVFTGRAKVGDGGELVPVEAVKAAWRARVLPEAGRIVTVTLTRERLRRSNPANRYLYGWVYAHGVAGLRAIAAENGEPCRLDVVARELSTAGIYLQDGRTTAVDVLHEWMVRKHLPHRELLADLGFGQLALEARTRKLDDMDFSTYTENVRASLAGWGVAVCAEPPMHDEGCPLAGLGRAA